MSREAAKKNGSRAGFGFPVRYFSKLRDNVRLKGSAQVTLKGRETARTQEATDKAKPIHRRPWWVTERDEPRTTIDDAVYSRFDKRKTVINSFSEYVGEDQVKKLGERRDENIKKRIQDNVPGYTLKDRALWTAARLIHAGSGGPNAPNIGMKSWNRISAATPEELGVDRFQGRPQEAARIVKVAARHLGAATIGITHLDKRHVYSHDIDGKEIAFEDVDEPYEDDYKRVIPEKCQWVVVMSLQMSRETLRRAPMVTGAQATMGAYSRMDYLVGATAEFIRGLGYVAIPSVNDTAAIIPFAIQAGLGELARTNRLVTPEYGPVVRLCKIFTDLPLATDKPIEFGVWEFCKKCMKCAEACPPKALSFDPEPSFNTRGPWNNPGHQGWFEDSVKCYTYWQAGPGTNCTICFAVCPFSKPKGILHSFVKTSIAKAPMLDKLFIVGDDIIGYGKQKDPEEWWNLDLDEYGIDGAH